MPIGPKLRSLLGPFERPIANLYRSFFCDLDALAHRIREWAPASRILEVGCGEGAMTERLSKLYPDAEFVGIDITPQVGRLFRGNRDRVTFQQTSLQDFMLSQDRKFDLLLICDVMHHVPWELHSDLLQEAKDALGSGGRLVLKEWERRPTPIHAIGYFSDRYITGDRIRYGTADQFRGKIRSIFGADSIEQETRVRPWRNNVAFLARSVGSPEHGTS
jgi:SAM-dependent methyltransferase